MARADHSNDDLITFYAAEYDESSRLAAAYNQLERVRTRELLQRHSPPPGARVVGGIVFAAAISRYAWPLYALRDGVELDDARVAAISATIESGCGDPVGDLPQAYSHHPAEFVEEARAAGLTGVQLFGIEGPGWTLLGSASPRDHPRLIENALTAARLLDAEPDMAGASAHLLVVGRPAG